MVKKIISLFLSVLLFATSLALPQVIMSFDEVGEKSNYLIPTNINMEAVSLETEDLRETYCEDILKEDLDFQTVSLTEKQAERLGLSNKVEEDFIVRAETTQNNDTYKAENYTWNIPFVKGTKTDTETLGSGKIKVGILDSGVSLNDELKDVQRIDLVPNTIYDPIGIYNDVTGHGTSVAGIITAEENKNGIIGIAPDVSVYSIRVLDHNNEAPISRIIAGIEWAIQNDINVLNMSFGTPNYSSQFYDVIRRAYEKGIVLVASAGNTGGKTEQVTYPAKFSEVISVGACNQSGVKSDFSPDSSDVDILAPGEYIECIGLMNGYCVENGTSLAAPHVTAAAALILSADSTKNPEFVKQLLISTANVKGDGCGILDIKNALKTLPEFKEVDVIDSAKIPKNTEKLENFEISEDVVVGSWDKSLHEDLVYTGIYGPDAFDDSDITEDLNEELNQDDLLSRIEKENILIFARAVYLADELYGYGNESNDGKKMYRFAPLHALGYTSSATSDDLSAQDNKNGVRISGMNSNYVADTKYLFRLAKHFMSKSSIKAAINSIDKEVIKAGANSDILKTIVVSKDAIYGKVERDEKGDIIAIYEVNGLLYSDVLWGTYLNNPERAGWAILGLAAHLAGDVFAHRTMIPTTARTKFGKQFYSNTAPSCFWGSNHIMWKDDNNNGKRDYRGSNSDRFINATPNLTRLRYATKEQVGYLAYYIKNYNLCTCYHCLRKLVGEGVIEFRDLGPKFINRRIEESEKSYNPDRVEDCYPERYRIGTTNAVEKLITQFAATDGDFTIYTFMPENKNYTIKLNGFKAYIVKTGVQYNSLKPKPKALVDKYSTGDDVL